MRREWGGRGRYSGSSWLPFSWDAIPVTRGILIATAVTFLAFFFTGQSSGPVGQWIPFRTIGGGGLPWLTRPWTWFTFPFMEMPSFWTLFAIWMFYSYGGTLERSWGSRNFAAIFFALCAVIALALVPASYLFSTPIVISGLTLPLVSLITAWASLDPEMECCFWGVKVKAKLVAAIFVGLVYFQFGMGYQNPLLALFVLAGPAAAWFYVRKMPRLNLGFRAPAPRRREPLLREEPLGAERERVSGFNPLRKRQEQLEIERLRKLLGDDDDRPLSRH